MIASTRMRRLLCATAVLALTLSYQHPARAQLSGGEVHIGIGAPLTTASATFGIEMRQAVDLAVAEKNAGGGILGAKILAVAVDDEANNDKGVAAAKQF